MSLERPQAPWPYDYLPQVPSFEVTSTDISDGETLADKHTATGGDVSPQLSWSGFPSDTAAFAITCFDPDAPTGSGWWHWLAHNLDASVTSLDTGAADNMPDGVVQLRNDSGSTGFAGAAPPPGDIPHRYIFAVHALKQKVDIDPGASCAVGSFNIIFNVLARGFLTPVYRIETE
ncbi:YbhB/YbcL family Raf kinase inhibitor-like protein [Haloglycomyces albus]|uniref:YbhB/YbcL family Raf kinase inhibitor-like protein n=1 Tax=Haloglycomyces albus TaxID=526067 RepID=UPI00046D4D52|nr:YbhB/YbcL family Raf kinase inhibitor-like protein [Haloglycomyces albus]